MKPVCPHCSKRADYVIDFRTIIRHGVYRRRSDSRCLDRWRCTLCGRTFSSATSDPCFRQKARRKNRRIFDLLASGVSMRRTARIEKVSRHTVTHRLRFFGALARDQLAMQTAFEPVAAMQFDDLETFEHTKYKPLSVTLAVEEGTRRILGFRVARMNAKGLLVRKAKEKYERRPDERSKMRKSLFEELAPSVLPGATIRSDSNPYYAEDVKTYFPDATHIQCLGVRGSISGSGELKKTKFDPIWSLNHTCAMCRANIARLIRKTWCTTKHRDRLNDHLAIYAVYHNAHLKKGSARGAASAWETTRKWAS